MDQFVSKILLLIRVASLWIVVIVMGAAVRIRPAFLRSLGFGPLIAGALLAFAAGHITGKILFH